MSVEREKLLNLLFPNGYPSDWDYKSSFNEYLNKVGNYKVEDLVKEPQRLTKDSNDIHDQTQELAVTNYKTFIETAQCSKQLSSHFNLIEVKLNELLNNIPAFEIHCHSFTESSSSINNLRRLNSLTLTKNSQLLEVLELPQLMNSFIDDKMYEDALELAAYVRRLAVKFPDVAIFNTILEDIEDAWFLMLHQLLLQLRQDLTLPKCLEIVGYLRRMDVFTEVELKLKFLQARGSWLQQCVAYIPTDDRNHHLAKTIELTRVNLFNIITHYRAVFADISVTQINSAKHSVNENLVFYSWIHDRIEDFLSILQEDLKYISSMESIMDQCMYFGLSFSKVGCDFRPLLVPIFTTQLTEKFNNSISKAMINFEKNIEKFTLINKTLPNIPWKSRMDDPFHPPDSLLEFYPLGEYLNHVLKSLNELRLCAPFAVLMDIVNSLQRSLIFIAKSLLELYSQEHLAFSSYSKDAFTRLLMCFSDDLIPHIQKYIHIIYPPSQVASHLGINLQTLQQEKISFLNKELIIDPIKHLLPQKIEPILNFDENMASTLKQESISDNFSQQELENPSKE
ncbi:conserved oligomeric Golgi complex subunit 8 [Cylas formicarius]|uniref:conserved oligomeric Golgi complex subunit 8 n=1 Tax=Cylas formicarius TaxID=197179 RepID=UPI002958C4CB|nr:conserved oligomeric Golgi complex subunit 8 [Cylas formicarius]XP_060530650.1 conserved oligomeric Golgi complex subunit 8 [Cylas formicarius]